MKVAREKSQASQKGRHIEQQLAIRQMLKPTGPGQIYSNLRKIKKLERRKGD